MFDINQSVRMGVSNTSDCIAPCRSEAGRKRSASYLSRRFITKPYQHDAGVSRNHKHLPTMLVHLVWRKVHIQPADRCTMLYIHISECRRKLWQRIESSNAIAKNTGFVHSRK